MAKSQFGLIDVPQEALKVQHEQQPNHWPAGQGIATVGQVKVAATEWCRATFCCNCKLPSLQHFCAFSRASSVADTAATSNSRSSSSRFVFPITIHFAFRCCCKDSSAFACHTAWHLICSFMLGFFFFWVQWVVSCLGLDWRYLSVITRCHDAGAAPAPWTGQLRPL